MSATTASNGYLIPTGFLIPSGGQVIETNAAAVRSQSIAWFRTEGPVGATLVDLPIDNPNDAGTQSAIQNTLLMTVARSCNTVRSPWSAVNPHICLPLFQQTAGQAGQPDQKIIFGALTTTGMTASSRMAGGAAGAPIPAARTVPVPPARSPRRTTLNDLFGMR